jgi:hypothetical protein
MVSNFEAAIALSPELLRIVTGFLGFVPSRFYLGLSCMMIHRAVSRTLYLSASDFSQAVMKRLFNPDFLYLSSDGLEEVEHIRHVLDVIAQVNCRKHRISLLERTLCRWAVADVAAEARMSTLQEFEWLGWETDHDWLTQAAKSAIEVCTYRDGKLRSDFHFFLNLRETKTHSSLGFLKRVIAEWSSPETPEGWYALLGAVMEC